MTKLRPRTRRAIGRVVPYGLIWLLFGAVFLISDYAAVGDQGQVPDSAIQLNAAVAIFALCAVTLIGLLIGYFEQVLLRGRFSGRSLAGTVALKSGLYGAVLLVLIVIAFAIAAALEMSSSVFDPRVGERLADFLISKTMLATSVQIAVSLGASIFYAELSEYMGQGVMTDFLTGKYFAPREEARIFMFSDMKSSTQIAEQLGHTEYFHLLKAYYQDLSDAIIDHEGEIYEYVGDEVVVSWPVDKGVRRGNCIRTYLAMKQDLARRADWYRDRFGIAPDFKAGLHLGEVTTGEIGALKKEIVFTGDVLNATARIQALCNAKESDILVSGVLAAALGDAFAFEFVEREQLRGREEAVDLFTLADSDAAAVLKSNSADTWQ